MKYAVKHTSIEEFYRGDLVFFRENGNPMVVIGIRSGCIECGWFNEDHHYVKSWFKPSMLVLREYAALVVLGDKWEVCLN